MKIHRVKFTNFRKFDGEHEFEITSGVFQIVGKNGAGKSSIIEAICYGLFGQTFKKSDNVITHGKTWCDVIVEVQNSEGDSVIVERKEYISDKNQYTIVVNGEHQLFNHKAGFDALVVSTLGVSYEGFVNSILVPQRGISLLYAKPEIQRTVLEELFNLSWIEKAKSNASALLKELDKKLSEITLSISELRQQRTEHEVQLGKLMLPYQTELRLKNERKEWLTSKINDVSEKIKNFSIPDKPLEPYEVTHPGQEPELNEDIIVGFKQFEDCQSCVKSLSDKAAALKAALKPCPKCGHAPGFEDVDALTKELSGKTKELQGLVHYKQLKEDYKALKTDWEQRNREFSQYQSKKIVYSKTLAEWQSFDSKLDLLKADLKNLSDELNSIVMPVEPDTSNIKAAIEEINCKVASLEEKSEAIAPERKVLEFWNNGLSVKGVKEFAFTRSVKLLNSYFQQFTTRESELVYEKNQVVLKLKQGIGFGDLSGGEQQILELCLSLALHKMAKTRIKTNCLFLDEPFTNLDTDAATHVRTLLEGAADSVYVISHTPIDAVGVSLINASSL